MSSIVTACRGGGVAFAATDGTGQATMVTGAAEVQVQATPRLRRRRCLLRRSPCEILAPTIGFILWRGGANAPPGRSGSDGGPGATLCRGLGRTQRKGDFLSSTRG